MATLIKCASCDKILESDRISYRCCDANVCSPECSFTRVQSVLRIDPTLTASHKWHDLCKYEYECPDYNSISFLNISKNMNTKSNNVSRIYDFSNLSFTALCDMGDIYCKLKMFIFEKLIYLTS